MKKRGFTLIETLMVVAIIGILVAILIPALAGARTNARKTLCAINVRDISQATLAYLNDNISYPKAQHSPFMVSADDLGVYPYLTPYLNIEMPNRDTPVKTLVCPSDTGRPDRNFGKPMWSRFGVSYLYNPGSVWQGYEVDGVNTPDGNRTYSMMTLYGDNPDLTVYYEIDFYHNQGYKMTCGFQDGHVAFGIFSTTPRIRF